MTIRTTPFLTVFVMAESMFRLHSVDLYPLAGDTVIQGTFEMATQFSLAETLIFFVPPTASMEIELVSVPKATDSSAVEQAARSAAAARSEDAM